MEREGDSRERCGLEEMTNRWTKAMPDRWLKVVPYLHLNNLELGYQRDQQKKDER
jgi:hypothetical protein